MLRQLNLTHGLASKRQQRGMTLLELLVAGVISIIAASGMVIVMAQTLGTGSQTIQMTRLTQEMRTSMQIMTRELRRANYHSTFMNCFGNVDCLGASFLNISGKASEINITDNGDSDCFWFWYDRPQSAGILTSPVAAFRRTIATGTIGKLQVFVTPDDDDTLDFVPGDCNSDADWVDITDPDMIDILTFNVSDADSFREDINPDGDFQSVERIALTITATLTNDASATRELQEFITVRNNTTTKLVAPTPTP